MNRILLVLSCSFLLPVAKAQRLIAVDSSRALVTIDAFTAAKTPLATVGANIGTPSGLAYDAAAGVMFAVSTTVDSLFTIDLQTGAATAIGAFGDAAIVMQGIELDTGTGTLYATSSHNGGLYTIDRITGAATLRGVSGLPGTCNLVYDSRVDRLFATSTGGDSLYEMNRATGAMTLIGNLQGSSNPHGLAFDAALGTVYMVDNASDVLYAIDTTTGHAHAIGSTAAGNLLGLACIPGGTGSVQRLAHHCGSPTIVAAGRARIGSGVGVWLDGVSGVPFVGFGVTPAAVPFCGCTIGHEWSLALGGATTNLNIPFAPALVGFQVAMQGLDLFGVGACVDPQLALTDTLVMTIG